jgi:hypothetical protein
MCLCLYKIKGRFNAMARAWRVWIGVAIEKCDDEVVTVPFSTAFGGDCTCGLQSGTGYCPCSR